MSYQDRWRWCGKCQALTYAGNASLGACPAGAQHDHASSGDYGLVWNDPDVQGQGDWRWCNKCQGLSYGGSASPGACSAGGMHDHAGSGSYTLEQSGDGTLGQDNWRWCKKCQVLSFAGGPAMGACAAGGQHDHAGSGDYVLAQVGACKSVAADVAALDHEVTAIQQSPGYVQGPHDPHPGRPDPEMLAQVKALEKQAGLLVSANNTCVQAQHDKVFDLVCDATRCVSINAVYANIAKRLDGKVVGYACSVGRTLTYQASGHARTSADGPARDFLASTKSPVASVSKIVTALTAIRVLAKHGISLDSGVGGHLPPSWALDARVKSITFRQLLSQSSGIKDYGNVTQDYAGVKSFFTQVVDPTKNTQCTGPAVTNPANPINANDKSRCYSNWNFAIFRILLPTIDGCADDAGKLAAAYVKLAQVNVFEPVGAFGVDSKPPAGGPQANGYAFGYKFPGSAGGTDWGDDTAQVGAAGWYLAVEDIAKVLASLNKNDGRILTPAQLADMQATQIGWDALTDATGYRWVEKNGGWGGGGNTTISTSIALFGPGVLGVLFMNSDISGEPGVGAATVLHDAYMAALQPRP